ncbi:MAG: hypothetical protein HY553_05020 [Elusimicrobia bacterium]|nr:hypothetical protein [Elusimicrobiota bacterium]
MDRRRTYAAIGLLAAALGLGLGALFVAGGGRGTESSRAFLPRPGLPGGRGEPSGSDDRLFAREPGPEAEEDVTFGDMLDILGVEASRPENKELAKQFKKEFMAEPELKLVYDEFAAAERLSPRRTMTEFLDRLGKLPAFQRLQAKFFAADASTTALLPLYQSPALGRFWRRDEKKPVDNPLVARIRRLARGLRLGFHRGPSAAGSLASIGGLRGGRGPFAASGGASTAYGAPGGEAGAQADAGPSSLLAGPNSHGVNPTLAPLTAADSDPMAVFCAPENFKWLCDFLDPAERLSMYNAIDPYGLWGACWELQSFDKCAAACSASGGKCSQKAGWNSCLEARGNAELVCLGECRTPPKTQWCTVPDDVKTRLCTAQWPASPPAECGNWATVVGQSSPSPTPGGNNNPNNGGDEGDRCDCGEPGSECTDWISAMCGPNGEDQMVCAASNGRCDDTCDRCRGGSNCNPCTDGY